MNAFSFKRKKKKNYFEGYYLRIIDKNKDFNKAFIFGVTTFKDDPHAFLQIVDGNNQSTKYYRYDIREFYYSKKVFRLPGIDLSLDAVKITTDDFTLEGTISNHVRINKRFGSNSAMSFMHHLPMKTYQEIVFQEASFKGTFNDIQLDGTSYMEKTYGTHFPSQWIWIQSNTFDEDIRLSCSIGKASILRIPFLGYVISVLYKGKEIRFATYLRNKISIKVEGNHTLITVRNRTYKLVIDALHLNPITLKGPIDKGEMVLDVYESITSSCTVSLYYNEELLIESSGSHVGMECMNYE